jgi:hypothetical protein
MGLFDFLRRKSQSDKAPSGKSLPASGKPHSQRNDIGQSGEIDDEGPTADYIMAHFALRAFALEKPLVVLGVAVSDDFERFITAILEDVEETCGKKATYLPSAVKAHSTTIGNFPCAIIQFPHPMEPTEAYMSAVVAELDLESEIEERPDTNSIHSRYFTLEQGVSLDGESRTVLAESFAEGRANYGDGPLPTPEAFADSIREIYQNA